MRRIAPLILSLALATAAPAARAAPEVFGLPFRLGVFGGWFGTSDDWDVLGERDADNLPGAGPTFGVRLGWRISRPWSLQWETALVLAPVQRETVGLGASVIEVDWRALDGGLTPLVELGLGVVASVAGPGRGDLDLLAKAALGVEVALGQVAALRLDVGLAMTDGVDGASWTPIATLGIDFPLWRERREDPAPEPDRPVPVGCPAGVAPAACVDSDDDGVIDAFDRCPIERGAVGGCPDPDGDGVTGLRDACPRDVGRAQDWGCPR